MGTNFYLRRVKPVEVHPEMHIAKRSAGWRIHFQDSTEGVDAHYFYEVDAPCFHSVREIRAVLERGEWQLADEYGETWEPGAESVAKFDELCRWNGGRAVTEHVCLADESRADDMGDIQSCSKCRYWHDPGWGEDDLGMCRRYPPTVPCMEGGVVEDHGIMMTDHPLVLWDGWCGEWKERE